MARRRGSYLTTRRQLLARIVREELFQARGVYALWPANAEGDDVRIFTGEDRATERATFHFLRQQMKKPADQRNHCLADYIAPTAPDYLGGFAVGIHGGDELAKRFPGRA